MRVARKLFLLGAMALAALALALTAGSASAQFEVSEETDGTGHCSEVVPVGAHGVSGGCHLELEGHIPLYAHIPAETPVMNCHLGLEAFIGEDGAGFVTRATFSQSTEPPSTSCTRQACDESSVAESPHAMLRWPFVLLENGPGDEIVEMTFCIRNGSSTEPPSAEGGTPRSFCEVHLRLATSFTHDNEIGVDDGVPGNHEFCEVSPNPFPISIRGHLANDLPDGEEVLIEHLLP